MMKETQLIQSVYAYDIAADQKISEIKTVDELKAQIKQWRADWLDMMGELPEKTPLMPEVIDIVKCNGYVVEKVLFQSQPGVYVTGMLFLPEHSDFKPPYPAVMEVQGHSTVGKLAVKHIRMAEIAVQAGFAVFIFDPISQGERFQCKEEFGGWDCAEEHGSLGARSYLTGWNLARFRLWDGIRAIDYLETRPELDLSRLAVIGNSGGGTMSTYLQAWDDRIKIACPGCYISSLREVIRERGVHDPEQFFFNQLPRGLNHGALVAMGQDRVDLMIAARHHDYFPIEGVKSTFALMQQVKENCKLDTHCGMFSCDGPHGWVEASIQANLAWLQYHIKGQVSPYAKIVDDQFVLDIEKLRSIEPKLDCRTDLNVFPNEKGYVTATGQVRDLPGFRSLYTLIAEEADRYAEQRQKVLRGGKEKLREIVRRRAGIHPLDSLPEAPKPFEHTFKWWYLKGPDGMSVELHSGILSILGKSLVGLRAEQILRDALVEYKANGNTPVPLCAEGSMCIAAAHAYAAEPELFCRVEFKNPPLSWSDMLHKEDPREDSFSVGVWGALREYDWIDLVPAELQEN